jgi:hypothetical protein
MKSMLVRKKKRFPTVEILDVGFEITGAPVDVRLTEPVDAATDRACCSLLTVVDVVVVFRVDEEVRLTGGS